MLDIRLLRENPLQVKEALARRSSEYGDLIDKILACDTERRKAETSLQDLRAERNRLSKEIGAMKARKEDSSMIEAKVKSFAEEMEKLTVMATELDTKQRDYLLHLPNAPVETVPQGSDASHNLTVRSWGVPSLEKADDHIAIGQRLGLFDLDRATKISGSGYVCFTGEGARLERALMNFLLDLHTRDHGYTEMGLPLLVRRECMEGTGQLPKFEDDMYGFDEHAKFLTPTAEVSLTNLRRDEIVSESDLPINMTACTACFRRESGSAGHDTRGIIRMHQFNKVELVKICRPEQTESELELLTSHVERVLQLLELPYRVLDLCAGDLGFSSARTYDLEVWAPGQGSFLEVSSCSRFDDYQARRMNLRYKKEDGKNQFCHTINGSGTALPRLYVALLETHTKPGGPLILPEVLHSYFGKSQIG